MASPLPIVAAVDGSPESGLALQEAARIATQGGSPLVIVAVVPPPTAPLGGPIPSGDWYDLIVRDFQAVLDRAPGSLGASQPPSCSTLLLRGPVVDTLVVYLEENPAQMVVVGARGRSALSRYFLGSVSEGLVHHAPCSILVVRPPKPPARSSAPTRP
jgi:nucleotide-binding universal stress UspA family protein